MTFDGPVPSQGPPETFLHKSEHLKRVILINSHQLHLHCRGQCDASTSVYSVHLMPRFTPPPPLKTHSQCPVTDISLRLVLLPQLPVLGL